MPGGGERGDEVGVAVTERGLAELRGVPETGEALGEGGGEGGGFAGLGEHADLRGDELRDGGGLQADAGAAGGHGFEINETEALAGAGEGEAAAIGEGATQLGVGEAAGKLDAVGDAQLDGEGFEAGAVVAIADETQAGDELGVRVKGGGRKQGEGLEKAVVTLVGVGGAEPSDAEDDGRFADGRRLGHGAGEQVGIEGVGHDAQARREPRVERGEPVARVAGNAKDAVAAAKREQVERGGFFPDLDAMRDESEAAAGAQGDGGDGELAEVTADDSAGAGGGAPGLAREGGFGAGAGGGLERKAVESRPGECGETFEVGGAVVEGDELERAMGGILGEGAQVKPQDALNSAIGGGEFGREENGFHEGAGSEELGAGSGVPERQEEAETMGNTVNDA